MKKKPIKKTWNKFSLLFALWIQFGGFCVVIVGLDFSIISFKEAETDVSVPSVFVWISHKDFKESGGKLDHKQADLQTV